MWILPSICSISALIVIGPSIQESPTRKAPPLEIDIGAGDDFGYSLANLGDVDGDGMDDCAIGNPLCHYEGGRARVWVFSGRSGSVVHEFADDHEFRIWSDYLQNGFGACVAAAGDLDGDGVGDIVFSSGVDRMRACSGRSGAVLFECPLLANPWSGHVFAAVNDASGDGRPDLVSGSVVLSGLDGGILRVLEMPFSAREVQTQVACVGDVDGDGCRDVVCAETWGWPAFARVFSGRSGQMMLDTRTLAIQQNGAGPDNLPVTGWIGHAGDVDCDGEPEILFGCDGSQPGAGESWILGARTALLHEQLAWDHIEGFRAEWLIVGDLDGDLVSEAVVPSSKMKESAVVVSLTDGRVRFRIDADDRARWTSWGRARAAANAGDLDDDGRAELLVSVLADSPGRPGYVEVHSGRDGAFMRRYSTASALASVRKSR